MKQTLSQSTDFCGFEPLAHTKMDNMSAPSCAGEVIRSQSLRSSIQAAEPRYAVPVHTPASEQGFGVDHEILYPFLCSQITDYIH